LLINFSDNFIYMKNFSIFILLNILIINFALSQNGISVNLTGAPADNSAILDVSSTSLGLLIPRMTTEQRDAIASPATSLLIFNTTTNCFEAYVNNSWYSVSCPPCNQPSAPSSGTNTASQIEIVWNWNTVSGATGYKWNTTNDYSTATDNFSSATLTQINLTCNSSYILYVWSYNSCGSSTAKTLMQSTESCGSCSTIKTVTDIDGNLYNVISIGTQCWMQSNLATTHYNDNNDIPNITDGLAWVALTTGAYCWYNNDYNTYGSIYGAMYNWYAVNTGKLCPTNWHVPSHDEWTTLERAICTSSTCATDFPYDMTSVSPRGTDEGGKLKEAGLTHWNSPNLGATNSSGFTALPAGYRRYHDGVFGFLGGYDAWWTSTLKDSTHSWYRAVRNDISKIGRDYGNGNEWGLSVRCLHD
jgi:uncharacterized protein (TIGR02145 family)